MSEGELIPIGRREKSLINIMNSDNGPKADHQEEATAVK